MAKAKKAIFGSTKNKSPIKVKDYAKMGGATHKTDLSVMKNPKPLYGKLPKVKKAKIKK